MQIFQVDAFTQQPFSGNPAAVCLLNQPRPDEWMQKLAQEMNLSETAFLLAEGEGYRLRWFTPSVEVNLCGHATLASAHVLWSEGLLSPQQTAQFYTRSGTLSAQLRPGSDICTTDPANTNPSDTNPSDTKSSDTNPAASNPGWIELNFPAAPPDALATVPAGLAEALGVEISKVWQDSEINYLLIELANPETVRALSPNFSALQPLHPDGIIVTAPGPAPYDFVSRFFAPSYGINEDPVTGSAHCVLGPYWGQRLGRTELLAYQASARGGAIKVRLDAGGDRVTLAGQAVTVFRGQLLA